MSSVWVSMLMSMLVCMVMMSMQMLSTLLIMTEMCMLQVDEDAHDEHAGQRVEDHDDGHVHEHDDELAEHFD